MGEFDGIRPYQDDEVPGVLLRLQQDRDLLQTLARYRFPRLNRWLPGLAARLVAGGVRRELQGVATVDALQRRLEPWLDKVIERSALQVTYSGLENLSKTRPHLFLANHRDIAMDPAFVNYALYHGGHPTPRIAIGDNLLQRSFVGDLMRLNKCFIVHRSVAGRREKLAVYQTLSAYIHHSIAEGHSVWIAQAEGRAKDGCDRTDTAIIKMLCMSRKNENFTEVVRSLNIVPVSIAYEWDPCDQMKARELEQRERTGSYRKQPGEDDSSIAKGLTGYKGRVHIAFGTPLTDDYADARAVASETDRQILGLYRLYPSNYLAVEKLPDVPAEVDISGWREQFEPAMLAEEQQRFDQRLAACPQEQRLWWLRQYANPVISRQKVSDQRGRNAQQQGEPQA